MRERPPRAQSGPAECPEDALICSRWIGIVGEGRLILIRSRENRQQLGKRCKVSTLDRCAERCLHTIIARDEGWIDGFSSPERVRWVRASQRPDALATSRPNCRRRRGCEQAPHVDVSIFIRGGVTQPTESQCEVRGAFMHRSEQGAGEIEIAFFNAREFRACLACRQANAPESAT